MWSATAQAEATWLTSPNKLRMSVTFLGVGKSFIDCNTFEHGLTDVSDISNPANSTVSLPKTNLSGFCVIILNTVTATSVQPLHCLPEGLVNAVCPQ